MSYPEIIKDFIKRVNSLQETMPMMMFILNTLGKYTSDLIDKLSENEGIDCVVKDGKRHFVVTAPQYRLFKKKVDRFDSTIIARTNMPRSYLILLVSQFDAYLGSLLRLVLNSFPELLISKDKKISYEEINQFDSVSALKEYIVEQEIDYFLRKSHDDQIKWIETSLKLDIRSHIACYSTFIEMTERRNVFVHCDGKISRQYLNVCRQHNICVDNCNQGQELDISTEYFGQACESIYEIAVVLGHAIWKKFNKNDLNLIVSHISSMSYDLILEERYTLALSILNYADQLYKLQDDNKLILLINKAQCYKWLDNQKACIEELSRHDWTVFKDRFQLAFYVLSDNFDAACEIMKSIGPTRDITKDDYLTWPLFMELRKSAVFKKTYREVFNEDYIEQADLKLTFDFELSEVASTLNSIEEEFI